MAWTAPRTWVAGEVPTAAMMNAHIRDNLLAIGQHTYVFKAADTSRVSTATLAADPDLTFAVGSGETWLWEAVVAFTDASAGVADIKFAANGPANTGGFWTIPNAQWGVSDTLTLSTAPPYDGSTAVSIGGAAAARVVLIRGSIAASSAGSVAVYWAQVASNASAVAVKAGSHLIARRIV